MYTTLVEEFVGHGHDVVVLAPGQNSTGLYKEQDITILRVKTLPIKNVPNYLKGISNLLLPYQYERALYKFYPKEHFDLIIMPTPPITLIDLAAKLKKKLNAKLYLVLRDIFPQNAVDLGFMKKDGMFHRFFRKKESKLYRHADAIGTMSQGNIDYIIQNNPEVDANKLHQLLNFQKPYIGFGSDKDALREKYKLTGKFVVVFGGNMGKPQQLENVLRLAESCAIYPDVVFLLLGEGVYMDRIIQKIQKENISNINVQRSVSKQEYQDLISVCHLGLISLHQDFTIPNIPSKTLDYFNVGLPVLASIDRATDYGQVLDMAEAGLWSYADDPESLFRNFQSLYQDEERRSYMGRNGNKYFKELLMPEKAYQTIVEQIS